MLKTLHEKAEVEAWLRSTGESKRRLLLAVGSVASLVFASVLVLRSIGISSPPASASRTKPKVPSAPLPGSPTLKPIFGGPAAAHAFSGWLSVWRARYKDDDGSVPSLPDAALPRALHGVSPKIVLNGDGPESGVVSEGMGWAILVEGIQAAWGHESGLRNGLALARTWACMVNGYAAAPGREPLGGGNGSASSSTRPDVWPYGVSAIRGGLASSSASGVPAWKFHNGEAQQGSATDGDEDAVLGMIYLAAALHYPEDFTDMVVRAVIAFASADLGFPDLYRSLPDGTRVFVPKGGSMWGGLLPPEGPYKTAMEHWCYNPSYFAPGHYRIFRDFVRVHWKSDYDVYLPLHLDGTPTTSLDLVAAFDGTVIAGYNLLLRSSCESGAVANWVGVEAPCPASEALSCPGVPWISTPRLEAGRTCTASGTAFGAYGADASRTPWRIAMDFIVYPEESSVVVMYDRAGLVDKGLTFGAQAYLNRIAKQYVEHAGCDGALPGDCSAGKLARAFEHSPGVTCRDVPHEATTWWAPFMSYPTFTAFVAPFGDLPPSSNAAWLDVFASLCDFSHGTPNGDVCGSKYFDVGQEVVSTMLMAGRLFPLFASQPPPEASPEPRMRERLPEAALPGPTPGPTTSTAATSSTSEAPGTALGTTEAAAAAAAATTMASTTSAVAAATSAAIATPSASEAATTATPRPAVAPLSAPARDARRAALPAHAPAKGGEWWPIRWANHPEKCLDAPLDGSPVQIWDCHLGEQQLFTWDQAGRIRWKAQPGLCLDVLGHGAHNGCPLHVWTCLEGGREQKFEISDLSNGKIHWASHRDLCLDITDHNSTNGNRIQTWECLDDDDDQFFVMGRASTAMAEGSDSRPPKSAARNATEVIVKKQLEYDADVARGASMETSGPALTAKTMPAVLVLGVPAVVLTLAAQRWPGRAAAVQHEVVDCERQRFGTGAVPRDGAPLPDPVRAQNAPLLSLPE